MSLKNPVTPPGIDPGTDRLVAQRLNHYATPDPRLWIVLCGIGVLLFDEQQLDIQVEVVLDFLVEIQQ
jgi:hypothetical protein